MKPKKVEKEKQKLLFRDDVLLVIALIATGTLYWLSKKYPDFAQIFDPLTMVLGGISALIFLGIVFQKRNQRERERRLNDIRKNARRN